MDKLIAADEVSTADEGNDERLAVRPALLCNLQQFYQDMLGCLRLREEDVPPSTAGAPRGAAAMTILGTLSRAIDEYDLLHFRQDPAEKLIDFAGWLQSEAPLFYEDVGDAEQGAAALAEADAVMICTVHKAKGKEWPAVFVPGLAEGRFPHSGQVRGRTKWHLLPRAAVRDAARYDTTREEEARLMYVSVTRSKKFLTCTYAPDPALAQPLPRSSFLTTFARCPGVQTVTRNETIRNTQQAVSGRRLPHLEEKVQNEEELQAGTLQARDKETLQAHKLLPSARIQERALVLTFSQIAAFLRCPYLFKLRVLYGWAVAPNEAEGFGKSGHDALSEIHTAAIAGLGVEGAGLRGDPVEVAAALTERHLLLPYAGEEGYQALAQAAARQLTAYLSDQGAQIAGVTHAEASFEITLDGLTITGRNDVVWSEDGEETLREIKSRREVQSEEITRVQLYIEDLGFHASTGRHVGYLEAYNLAGGNGEAGGASEKPGVQFREAFNPRTSEAVKERLKDAGQTIRQRELIRLPVYGTTCQHCDHPSLCRDKNEE